MEENRLGYNPKIRENRLGTNQKNVQGKLVMG
jgi:hypothetical protein